MGYEEGCKSVNSRPGRRNIKVMLKSKKTAGQTRKRSEKRSGRPPAMKKVHKSQEMAGRACC